MKSQSRIASPTFGNEERKIIPGHLTPRFSKAEENLITGAAKEEPAKTPLIVQKKYPNRDENDGKDYIL